MNFFETPTHHIDICQQRLAYYTQKMSEYDEEEHEDWQVLEYIKERIAFWKAELLKAEEDEYFKHLNQKFSVE